MCVAELAHRLVLVVLEPMKGLGVEVWHLMLLARGVAPNPAVVIIAKFVRRRGQYRKLAELRCSRARSA